MKLLITLSSSASPNFLRLRSRCVLITLFSDTLNLYSSLSVRDQVSNPYKTTGKIMILYVFLIYRFLKGKQEDKIF